MHVENAFELSHPTIKDLALTSTSSGHDAEQQQFQPMTGRPFGRSTGSRLSLLLETSANTCFSRQDLTTTARLSTNGHGAAAPK